MVAGDEGGVDGADGGADDPVGHQIVFVQRLVHPGLVGAKGAAALQHEHDAQLVRIEGIVCFHAIVFGLVRLTRQG